jgi:hypothetical protein
MPAGFEATDFSVTEQGGVLTISLGAPSTEHDDFYLVLQSKDSYSAEDGRFGFDQPHLEYCGQGWSWYGHIESFQLLRDRVLIQMNEAAARRMQNDGALHVRFNLDEEQFERLRAALERTFKNVQYFRADA